MHSEVDAEMGEAAVVAESIHAENDNNDDEDDKEPVLSRRRSARVSCTYKWHMPIVSGAEQCS